MTVYLDISQFVRDPQRSGIQRVVSRICEHWPTSSSLIPVILLPDNRLQPLADSTRGAVSRYMSSHATALHVEHSGEPFRFEDTPHARLFVPELFYDAHRAEYYRNLPPEARSRTFCLVYDLIPLTRPDLFPSNVQEIVWPFYRLLPSFGHRAFISAATRRDYYHRLCRMPEGNGPVLTLGSDTFAQFAAPGARTAGDADTMLRFLVLGTIEPKKSSAEVLQAFMELLPDHPKLSVTFAGRQTLAFQQRMRIAAERFGSRFEFLSDVDDNVVGSRIAQSTAVVFVSTGEGFGLPALESLHLGIPAIVSKGLPSIEEIGTRGLIRIERPETPLIRDAILSLTDPLLLAAKRAEARDLRLKTWAQFVAELCGWVEDTRPAELRKSAP